jgi:ubiquinone/menaquinone biosynthesis C-methylase UbiE
VIAVPEDPKNVIFQKIAQKYGISCFFGSKENVLLRSKGAIDSIFGNIVVHVMGQHCFVDPVLLEKMIEKLHSTKSAYVSLPDDFTPYFAGKIYERLLLDQVNNEINKLLISKRSVPNARFFSFIESNRGKFNTTVFNDLPNYSKEYLKKVRRIAREIFIDDRLHITQKNISKVSNPLIESYEFAKKQMKLSSVVLDVACGDGFGCRIISPQVLKVIGLDINKEIILNNRQKNRRANIAYEEGDACSLNHPDQSFDVVTGMEIIEHILPDKIVDLLSEIRRVLKPDGVFICSTPQNSMGYIPVVPWHEKEYSLSEFKTILNQSFPNIKVYGSKSGGSLTEDEHGQKMVAVCRLH